MDTPDYAFLEIADVTGDGNLDIVGAGVRLNPTVTEVFVFIGDGDGGFSQPVISAVDAASPFLLSFASPLADYNGDGRLDVCLAALIQEEDPRVKLVIGYSQEDGAISFVVSHALGEYVPRPAIATGDFNGDALPDINILHVVEGDWLLNPEGESATGLSSMYYNNGDGSFAEETLIDLQIPGRKAFSSDLNSDGYDDLVSFDGNGNAGVWLGSATTRQQDVQVYTCLHTPNTRTWSPFMGDFTNDGNVDIGVDLMEPEVGIRFGNGLGGFGTGWFSPPIDSPTTRLQALEDFVADFDGDGHLDLVQLISTDVTVAFGDGTGRFPEIVPILYAREMDEWEIAAGDVNGDGADDLLISSRSNREAGLRLFWGGPDRSFPEGPAAVAGASEHGIEDVSLVDIDEDGHLDLIYAFNGVLHVTHGDGAGSFEVYTSIGEPPTLNGPDPAIYDYWLEDVNKDSYVDIITNAFPSLYRLWLNDGNNRWIFTEEHEKVYYQSNREAWDAAPEWVRIPQIEISYHRADLDNDGIADFVTANDSLLQIALTGSEAALLNFCAQGHGQLVRVRNPIAADINGDGWLDLITASANYITVVLNRLGEASL